MAAYALGYLVATLMTMRIIITIFILMLMATLFVSGIIFDAFALAALAYKPALKMLKVTLTLMFRGMRPRKTRPSRTRARGQKVSCTAALDLCFASAAAAVQEAPMLIITITIRIAYARDMGRTLPDPRTLEQEFCNGFLRMTVKTRAATRVNIKSARTRATSTGARVNGRTTSRVLVLGLVMSGEPSIYGKAETRCRREGLSMQLRLNIPVVIPIMNDADAPRPHGHALPLPSSEPMQACAR